MAAPACVPNSETKKESANEYAAITKSPTVLGRESSKIVFPTGDLVRIDDDTGFMYFIGRKKDIIVLSSGTNIAPIAIEEYFVNNLNFIEECMVYSLNNNQLICEIYAPHRPDDISILYDLNEAMPIEQRVHQFIFRNQPFTKDKKMSIVRKRSI